MNFLVEVVDDGVVEFGGFEEGGFFYLMFEVIGDLFL